MNLNLDDNDRILLDDVNVVVSKIDSLESNLTSPFVTQPQFTIVRWRHLKRSAGLSALFVILLIGIFDRQNGDHAKLNDIQVFRYLFLATTIV